MSVFFFFNQVWLCGGSIEIIPCSKIAHIERAHKPYAPDVGEPLRRNALRVAEIWMDEYKRNVLISWNLPEAAQKEKHVHVVNRFGSLNVLGMLFFWKIGCFV